MKIKCMILMVMLSICSISFVNAGFRIPKIKGGHTKNARPSTLGKHQAGDARRQREQKKAEERRAATRKGSRKAGNGADE